MKEARFCCHASTVICIYLRFKLKRAAVRSLFRLYPNMIQAGSRKPILHAFGLQLKNSKY